MLWSSRNHEHAQLFGQSDWPFHGLAQCVGCRARKHWKSKQTGSNNATREKGERKRTSDWSKRFGCLRSSLNVRHSMRIECCSGRNNDKKSYQVGKRHADSMCVPIFLAGRERMADPEAYFMFHQVSVGFGAKDNKKDNTKRPEFSDTEKVLYSEFVKSIEARATDDFFRSDIGIRGVSAGWTARMRENIAGRDIWMSGQQLVDEGSGIVDRLVRTPAR